MAYKKGNIFQPDAPPEELSQEVVTLRCPHCSNLGTFRSIGDGVKFPKEIEDEFPHFILISLVQCPNNDCRGFVFSIREIIPLQSGGYANHFSFCLPMERVDFNTDFIPDKLVRTLSEAITCCANGAYRASAMMARRLLEEVCDEAGATGKNLHIRLAALRNSVILSEALFDAADEMKILGNDAAHVEAKHYDEIGKEEAEICIEISKEILKARYQMNSLVERIRSLKS